MEVPINQNKTLQDLIEYVKLGANDQVKTVIESQSNIKTPKNMTSLAKAAVEADSKDIIVTLLEHGLNVNATLDIVVNSGKDDLIELMLDRGADVNEGLYFAVKANKKDTIIYLLDQGANINTNKRNGNTPLHAALMQKICDVELVEFLIKRGADTQVQTQNNKTPLDLFQKFLNGKHDSVTKKKLENVAMLLSDNQSSNVFECIMGLPDGLSGYSYQAKIFTLYAIMNTKQAISCACQYELSTEVKNLVPFDDIYLRRIQEGRTSCEFIQVKQTKKPEFNKISPSKFFTMLKPECKVKEYIKGNDSIVKIFLKYNEIQESLFNINTSGIFIHCENTTFQDDSSPYLKRVDADPNDSFLCGIKHVQWIIDKDHLFVEIKYVLLNLIETSLYFSIMEKEFKNNVKNQIQILDELKNKNVQKNLDDKIMYSINAIGIEGLEAVKKYLEYLGKCKREIEKALDIKDVHKNLPDKFELLYTDDLALLINRAISKINEVSKSFSIDKEFYTYFSKFDDSVIREKIDNFVKHFSIYTNCPTSDELDEIITKEINEEFKFDIPTLISGHCLQFFNRWISNFKNEKGRVFTGKDGKKLFRDIKIKIFNAFNKSYIEEVQRNELCYIQNNEQVIRFLNKDNNNKILHVNTKHARLHTMHILQTIKNVMKQSTNLDHLNNIACTNLENILKSEANLKNLFDALNLQDRSDLLILECLEDVEEQEMSTVKGYLKHIMTANARIKVIVIAKYENQLIAVLKVMTKEFTSYNGKLSLKDLTDESQQRILRKSVNFRNNPKSIRTLLKIENFLVMPSACEVIDEYLLTSIVTNIEDIQIGNQKAFISSGYNDETFILRYLQNIDVTILQKCTSNLFFVTGITKNELIAKISINENVIHDWDKDKVFNEGIVLVPHSHSIPSEEICKLLASNSKLCYWFEFRGELLYINRKDVSKEYKKRIESISKIHNIALENIKDKIVIIANDAGEGKSTMLTHLAHCMRNKSNSSWIIRIDLRNYADNNLQVSLNDITFSDNDINKAVELIASMVVQVESTNANNSIERTLLEAVLNGHGKMEVIMLFDGFDEISPGFKEKTCKLLKTLVKSHIKQLWVTTRVHLKEYLEKELGVSAHMMVGFTELEQVQLICNIWKWQLNRSSHKVTEEERTLEIVNKFKILIKNSIIDEDDCNFLLNELQKYNLAKLQKIISSESYINHLNLWFLAEESRKLWVTSQSTYDFLKIPLHVEMFAVNLIKRKWNQRNYRNSLQFGMYTEFIDNKLEIYGNRSTIRTGNQYANDQADMVKVLLKKMHHEIAVKTLHSSLKALPNTRICSEYPNILEKLTRVGLVKFYGSRVEFVHRAFAEYFFSEYLVTHLDHPRVQTECLEKILLYEDYHLVRIFFDEFLLQYQKQNIAGYVKTFANILKPRVTQRIIKQLINNENVLHVAVRGGHLQILLLIINNITSKSFAKLIMKNSHEGGSILQLSINIGYIEMSNTIIDSVKKLTNYSQDLLHSQDTFIDLVLKCDTNERTALHLAVIKEQRHVCKSIIDAAKACSVFEKLVLCIDSYKKSALHYAVQSSNREVMQVIIESIEDNYNLFNELITIPDTNGQQVIHIAAEVNRVDACYIILKSVERYEGMLKYLIKQCDTDDNNALHLAVICNRIDICKLLLETAERHYLLNELTMKTNSSNKTILHLAAETLCEPLCTLVLKTVKDHKEIVKYLITQQDDNGRTALHIATRVKETGICDVILNTAKNCKEDLKNVLTMRDNHNRTVLEMAVKSNDDVTCFIILNYAVKHEDVFRDVIMQCDVKHGWTALHLAAILGNSKICCVILNFAKVHQKTLKNLITQCDNHGYTTLELAEWKIHHDLIINNVIINGYTVPQIAQYKYNIDFDDVFIANILQSHYALRVWLFRIKSKVKVIHNIRTVKCKNRSNLTTLYAIVLKRQTRISDYISKLKEINEKLKLTDN